MQLLKEILYKNRTKLNFAVKFSFEQLSEAKLYSFQKMKRILLKNQILMYANANYPLFMDFDTSKAKSVGIILYHVIKNVISNSYPDKTNIEPIMFLLQQLRDTEIRY